MYLAYLILPLLVAGVAFTALGLAPIGIPLLLVAAVVLAVRSSDRFKRGENEPVPGDDNNTGEEGPGTGFAHKGQGHMVP